MAENIRGWDETLRDSDWIRSSFMLSEDNTYEQSRQYRVFNTASMKYTTTRLGYNWAINTPPQRTRHADIKFGGDTAASTRMLAMVDNKKGKIDLNSKEYKDDVKNTGTATLGMGRWYSEAIDDNNQLIHMSFGVPNFRGLVSFFTGFYDHELGILANEGRANDLLFTAGKVLGFVIILPYWKWVALGRVANWVVNGGAPPTSYYSMNRKMHLYWKRADFIANSLAANLGIVPRTFDSPFSADLSKQTQASEMNPNYSRWFKEFAPDLFEEGGKLKLYNIAIRAQRLANKRYKDLESLTESNKPINQRRAEMAKYIQNWHIQNDPGGSTIEAELIKYFKVDQTDPTKNFNSKNASGSIARTESLTSQLAAKMAGSGSVADADVSGLNQTDSFGDELLNPTDILYPSGAKYNEDKGIFETIGGWFMSKESLDILEAENNQGSQWVTFKVDFNGTVSESFSNSFGAPSIKEKINGMSGAARQARFDFSDGKLGIGGVDQVLEGLQSFATGAVAGVGLSGLIALSGSAFTDFPDTWQDSSADWPSQSFTMKLRPWAGNKMSQFLYMYVPISLLLAAALPLSTGSQSYTAPFLCEMWSRGRNTIRLGMIDSLEIQRGVGNMGWNNENEPLGIDITFTVKDLSTVMHAPISSFGGVLGSLNPISQLFPNDSRFNDYLATLGNLSMADQTQAMRKLSLNMTKYGLNWNSFWSKGRFYNWYGSTWMGGLAANFTRDSERIVSY